MRSSSITWVVDGRPATRLNLFLSFASSGTIDCRKKIAALTFSMNFVLMKYCRRLLAVLMILVVAACRPEEANGPSSSSNKDAKATPVASGTPKAFLSQEQLQAAFAASSDILFAAKDQAALQKFKPLQQVEVIESPQGLSVKATGIDPSLTVPEFPLKPCIVKIEISSPAETNVQLFYLIAGQPGYDENHSVVAHLKAGTNVAYLHIDEPTLAGGWRLDPGDVPGNYLLQGFEVRAKAVQAP